MTERRGEAPNGMFSWFDKRITVGNLLTVLTYIVVTVFFVARIESEFRDLRRILGYHQHAINAVHQGLIEHQRQTTPDKPALSIPPILPLLPNEKP